jgi:polyphosphate glucokinase
MDHTPARPLAPLTLGIDVGGSHLKAGVLDPEGQIEGERRRVATPQPAEPVAICRTLVALANGIGPFDRISIGFPGVVRHGAVLTAPNLDNAAWAGFPLVAELRQRLGKPTRLLNDAEVAGLGVIAGRGLECVITLGTGMGFAVFQDGTVGPHLELSHIPVRHGMTYDEYLGQAALDEVGRKHWNRRLRRVIRYLAILTHYDTLYIGGGNAKLIRLDLPESVRVVPNEAGIMGGVRLWDAAMDHAFLEPA